MQYFILPFGFMASKIINSVGKFDFLKIIFAGQDYRFAASYTFLFISEDPLDPLGVEGINF